MKASPLDQLAECGAQMNLAAMRLAQFVWLSCYAQASGISHRVYPDYGGVYVATALIWLRVIADDVKLFAPIGQGLGLRHLARQSWR
ncbi:MAG: hypothetical protein CMI59_16785 [Parvibaculum sp.]|jgi:small multidrug resistance family-3 protein|nr:hypothetical protein [Parvibaculum sp.]